eukprot:jgi/Mesvir1/19096/Mv12846-RA.2
MPSPELCQARASLCAQFMLVGRLRDAFSLKALHAREAAPDGPPPTEGTDDGRQSRDDVTEASVGSCHLRINKLLTTKVKEQCQLELELQRLQTTIDAMQRERLELERASRAAMAQLTSGDAGAGASNGTASAGPSTRRDSHGRDMSMVLRGPSSRDPGGELEQRLEMLHGKNEALRATLMALIVESGVNWMRDESLRKLVPTLETGESLQGT